MTCQYDYHHTIYDLATIYDLYVPICSPQPRSHMPATCSHRERMDRVAAAVGAACGTSVTLWSFTSSRIFWCSFLLPASVSRGYIIFAVAQALLSHPELRSLVAYSQSHVICF